MTINHEQHLDLLVRHAMSLVGGLVQQHPAAKKQMRGRQAGIMHPWTKDQENFHELMLVKSSRAAEVVDWLCEGRDEPIFALWREMRATVSGDPLPRWSDYVAALESRPEESGSEEKPRRRRKKRSPDEEAETEEEN